MVEVSFREHACSHTGTNFLIGLWLSIFSVGPISRCGLLSAHVGLNFAIFIRELDSSDSLAKGALERGHSLIEYLVFGFDSIIAVVV